MKIKLGLTMWCLAMLWNCTAQPTGEITQAKWLIGTWENKTSRGSIYEDWREQSNSEWVGMSFILQEKDTVVFETIRLIQEEKGLFYIPIVKDQNNSLPVRFGLKSISESQVLFENLQHDFPQFISYTQIHADSLVAEISGFKNGKEQKQIFPMSRMK
ncbi:DUF6265 family protein [Reichenbachiella faecimaris]|nr:DUF6265 family protein [Reichenbachiella faecimaris]